MPREPGRIARALVLAGCAAGCFSDKGLALQIDVGATGAQTVELYLGMKTCDEAGAPAGASCRSIAPPPSGTTALDGEIRYRDAADLDITAVHGTTATFQLRAAAFTKVPVAIAVGVDASGRPVGAVVLERLEIPADDARVVSAALIAAGPVQPGQRTDASEYRVQLWNKTRPASSCVLVEHWRGGEVNRTFVVPKDDPDCDDVAPDAECDPMAYRLTRSGPNCAVAGGTINSACFIGTRVCDEASGAASTSCQTSVTDRMCVPDAVCEMCPGDLVSCLVDRLASNPGSLPRLECTVPSTGARPCTSNNRDRTTVEFGSRYGVGCSMPQIAPLAAASLAPTSFSSTPVFQGAMFQLTSPPLGGCGFEIRWPSGGERFANASPDDYGALRVSTTGGFVVVPISLHFVEGCDQEFACDLEGDDASLSCAMIASPP
jgi:hypothetical protein